jgi:hypothetical protein
MPNQDAQNLAKSSKISYSRPKIFCLQAFLGLALPRSTAPRISSTIFFMVQFLNARDQVYGAYQRSAGRAARPPTTLG